MINYALIGPRNVHNVLSIVLKNNLTEYYISKKSLGCLAIHTSTLAIGSAYVTAPIIQIKTRTASYRRMDKLRLFLNKGNRFYAVLGELHPMQSG